MGFIETVRMNTGLGLFLSGNLVYFFNMSHFIQIKTVLKEEQHIIAALNEMGLECRTGEDLFVESWENTKVKVDILIETGSKYKIGLKKVNDAYDIVADWWAIESFTKIRQHSFIPKLNKLYAYSVIKDQLKEQNLVIESEQELENGDLVLMVSERA